MTAHVSSHPQSLTQIISSGPNELLWYFSVYSQDWDCCRVSWKTLMLYHSRTPMMWTLNRTVRFTYQTVLYFICQGDDSKCILWVTISCIDVTTVETYQKAFICVCMGLMAYHYYCIILYTVTSTVENKNVKNICQKCSSPKRNENMTEANHNWVYHNSCHLFMIGYCWVLECLSVCVLMCGSEIGG